MTVNTTEFRPIPNTTDPQHQAVVAGTRPLRSASPNDRTIPVELLIGHGVLNDREDRQASRLQAGARRVWRQASRRRYRRWMH